MTEWKSKIQSEFERAEAARTQGNEGQARVCARRAAGIAIREYYSRLGHNVRTPSAYDLLNILMKEPHLHPDLKQAAVYLTLHVNEKFELPVDIDLLEEARKLCGGLLKK